MTPTISRAARALAGFGLGTGASFLAATLALAVGGGADNARDQSVSGWIGDDAPGIEQFWAYNSVTHDFILSEWVEPSHDWVRTRNMDWSYASADYLNQISSYRNLEFSVKITNETYYNGINNWTTNAPYSKAPEGSSFAEEAIDHYTEVEMEMINPYLISNTAVYYWDQQFNSERTAISTAPKFSSQLENCNELWGDCFYDETGWMRKKVLQQ